MGTSIMQIRDLLVSAYAHYQDTCLSLNHAHQQTMSNTKTEKYENISSRDYVPRYLKISRAETMSRLMGREHPAPKPLTEASMKISHPETMSRLMGREHPAPKPLTDASMKIS